MTKRKQTLHEAMDELKKAYMEINCEVMKVFGMDRSLTFISKHLNKLCSCMIGKHNDSH